MPLGGLARGMRAALRGNCGASRLRLNRSRDSPSLISNSLRNGHATPLTVYCEPSHSKPAHAPATATAAHRKLRRDLPRMVRSASASDISVRSSAERCGDSDWSPGTCRPELPAIVPDRPLSASFAPPPTIDGLGPELLLASVAASVRAAAAGPPPIDGAGGPAPFGAFAASGASASCRGPSAAERASAARRSCSEAPCAAGPSAAGCGFAASGGSWRGLFSSASILASLLLTIHYGATGSAVTGAPS